MGTVFREAKIERRGLEARGPWKLTPNMLRTIELAEAHKFTEHMQPWHVLAAFNAAAPYLRLRANIIRTIDWLFRFTNLDDWRPPSRPIVWPSSATQTREFCPGSSQVKSLNRRLVELGLVVMKDNPNGKRYGRRDSEGRIIEAYGFDLSPLASRYSEFKEVAEKGRKARSVLGELRRRATIAQRSIRQLLEAAVEQGFSDDQWQIHHTAALSALDAATSKGASAARYPRPLRFKVSRSLAVHGTRGMRLATL